MFAGATLLGTQAAFFLKAEQPHLIKKGNLFYRILYSYPENVGNCAQKFIRIVKVHAVQTVHAVV